MNTPSSSPPRPSWSGLVQKARQAPAPGSLDVRFSVRAAIEAETRAPRAARTRGVFDDLAVLSQSWWTRGVLAGCAALAVVAVWNGLDVLAGLSVAMDLQGALLAAF